MDSPTNTSPPKLEQPSFFSGFRSEGFPAIYEELKTAAHVDVLEAGLVLAFVILGFSLLLILPGSALGLQKLNVAIRIVLCVITGALLAVTNFGQQWEVGHVVSNAPYKPLIADEIEINLHLHIGLRSINVTMKAEKELPQSLKNEIIDYNEQFSWTWDQGRFGFGPFAGRIQREFRDAQRKGLPLPILWVVDYFTLDGEGYRFGRFYRTAGWYAHIAMWSALTAWMLSCILLHCALFYGSILTCLTGLLQLLACLIWASVRNAHALFIPFEDANLTTSFGQDFWITLVNGLLCTVLGMILIILNQTDHNEETLRFFGIDPISDYDEHYYTREEYDDKIRGSERADHEMEPDTIEMDPQPSTSRGLAVPETMVVLTRRGTRRLAKHSIRNPPRPLPRRPAPAPPGEDEQPFYGNREAAGGYNNRGYQR